MKLADLKPIATPKGWYESAGTTRVSNIVEMASYFREKEKRDPLFWFGLYANHVDALTALWGKPNFIYASEYRWHGWVLPLCDSEQLVLLSSKGGGSSFEVALPDKSYPPRISAECLSQLQSVLSALQTELGNPRRRATESQPNEP